MAFIVSVLLFGAGFGVSRLVASNDSVAVSTTNAPAEITAVTLPAGEEPVAAVARSLMPSVVQIENSSGVGAGFVYDTVGYILTAAHVVEGFDRVTVVFASPSSSGQNPSR